MKLLNGTKKTTEVIEIKSQTAIMNDSLKPAPLMNESILKIPCFLTYHLTIFANILQYEGEI